MANISSLTITLVCLCWLIFFVGSYKGQEELNPFKLIKEELSRHTLDGVANYVLKETELPSQFHVSNQEGLKEKDKIEKLAGEPEGVEFEQYSGYVTVDPEAGRALFYYFVESPFNSSSKPLALWLNGGPGCSSFGAGAMMELGPFRVNKDGLTLTLNKYAWTNVANIIFLESPAGVGFSYSNTTSDYELSGDKRTAQDSYTFLVNWLERFPEYKLRDFFIAGESYAGHYVPQLAQLILHSNRHTNHTNINLRGIALGNALIDLETTLRGAVDYYWTHALMSDEMYLGFLSKCKFTSLNDSDTCLELVDQATDAAGAIYRYDIYAPLCNSSSNLRYGLQFDPCSVIYIHNYLNIPQVQSSLHANVTGIPYPWQSCSGMINRLWKDRAVTVLPTIQELMSSGIRVWIYSGDTDGALPVTCTRYAIKKLGSPILTTWYPWYIQGEVGGYAVEYRNLTFVTIRGSGHFVPSYQPVRALALFLSFVEGKLPPATA